MVEDIHQEINMSSCAVVPLGSDSSPPENPVDIVLVGAGNMGGAMLRGWIDAGLVGPRSAIIDPMPSDEISTLCKDCGISIFDDPGKAHLASHVAPIIVLAIKPQLAAHIVPTLAPLNPACTLVSVMAGQSLASIERFLGRANQPMVRAMPNVGASLGAGATGLYANDHVEHKVKDAISILMAAIGAVVWVDKEAHIDVVTAISGSGPAYYFLLTQALEEAGRDLGLDSDAASILARATAFGAGQLLHHDPRSATDLRYSVTSPGGTTQAAIEVFETDSALRSLTKAATTAALKRAEDLNS